jgi:hypothetical protein
MIDMLTLIAFFVLGFLTGIVSMTYVVMLIGKRSLQSKSKDKPSLEQRMKRVKDIADEQLELHSRIDGPQKNALHGKHKNSLLSQLKALDEEKTSILQSILSDGHDPRLKTIDGNGVITEMKLSEFMATMGYVTQKPTTPPPAAKPSGPERMGKFTVYRGGKDDEDGGNNTTH